MDLHGLNVDNEEDNDDDVNTYTIIYCFFSNINKNYTYFSFRSLFPVFIRSISGVIFALAFIFIFDLLW